MSHWTSYFDKVFLINLPHRTDRLQASTETLSFYNIPFEIFEAIKDVDGKLGLYRTMMALFLMCQGRGYNRILVFEDDLKFLLDPTETMNNVVKEICPYWDLLYLGCNATVEFKHKFSENILCNERSFSTHAVGYSAYAMEFILQEPMKLPFDLQLCDGLQKERLSFCVTPMLVSQSPGWSDIEKRKVTNYDDYLENRFSEQTKNIL